MPVQCHCRCKSGIRLSWTSLNEGLFEFRQLRAVLLSIVVAGAVVVLAFAGASVDALILSC